jgi:hypothetical protein
MQRKERDKDNTSFSPADLEPNSCNASLGKKEIKRLDSVIDACVHYGLLANDTAKEVKGVYHTQEKIQKTEKEETIITISWQ